jgi:DinB superfamily
MQSLINQSLWFQLGASIDMLIQAIRNCPNYLWDTPQQFWYKAYHALYWTDYYASTEPEHFLPPSPFTLSEMDANGLMPPCIYSPAELLDYAAQCKQKCKNLIDGLDEQTMQARFVNEYRDYSRLEIILYNMRHIQHHTGQLNTVLRQGNVDAMQWISRVDGNSSFE